MGWWMHALRMKCPRCQSTIILRKGHKTVCLNCGWQSGAKPGG